METSLQEQSEAELCRLWEELEAARRLGDKLAKAAALRAIVQVLRELKRFDEAISCCRQHATLCAILADPVSENYSSKLTIYIAASYGHTLADMLTTF